MTIIRPESRDLTSGAINAQLEAALVLREIADGVLSRQTGSNLPASFGARPELAIPAPDATAPIATPEVPVEGVAPQGGSFLDQFRTPEARASQGQSFIERFRARQRDAGLGALQRDVSEPSQALSAASGITPEEAQAVDLALSVLQGTESAPTSVDPTQFTDLERHIAEKSQETGFTYHPEEFVGFQEIPSPGARAEVAQPLRIPTPDPEAEVALQRAVGIEPYAIVEEQMGEPERLEDLKDVLRDDEGVRRKVYTDTRGNRTIGVGHNIEASGRTDLVGKTLSDSQIDELLDSDIAETERQIKYWIDQTPYAGLWDRLTPDLKNAMSMMGFQMGARGLVEGFPEVLRAIVIEDPDLAAATLENSDWATSETRPRALRVIDRVRKGITQAGGAISAWFQGR